MADRHAEAADVLARLIRGKTDGLDDVTVQRLADSAATRYMARCADIPFEEFRRLVSEVLDDVLRELPMVFLSHRMSVGAHGER